MLFASRHLRVEIFLFPLVVLLDTFALRLDVNLGKARTFGVSSFFVVRLLDVGFFLSSGFFSSAFFSSGFLASDFGSSVATPPDLGRR